MSFGILRRDTYADSGVDALGFLECRNYYTLFTSA